MCIHLNMSQPNLRAQIKLKHPAWKKATTNDRYFSEFLENTELQVLRCRLDCLHSEKASPSSGCREGPQKD